MLVDFSTKRLQLFFFERQTFCIFLKDIYDSNINISPQPTEVLFIDPYDYYHRGITAFDHFRNDRLCLDMCNIFKL